MSDTLLKSIVNGVFQGLILLFLALAYFGFKNINQILYPLKNFKKKKQYLLNQNKHLIGYDEKIIVERPKKKYGKWNVYKVKNGKKQYIPFYSISDSELDKINFN